MPDIIYWGNGGVTAGKYTAPKEVASVAIVQLPAAQVLSWDTGLPTANSVMSNSWGSISYSLAEPYLRSVVSSRCASGFPLHTKFWYLYPSDGLGRWIRGTDLFTCSQGVSVRSCSQDVYFPIRCNGAAMPSQKATVYSFTDGTPMKGTRNDFYALPGSSPTFGFNGGQILVSGSASDGGYPIVNKDSISLTSINSGCVLSIAYTDSSTEQIPLSECYEWARIRDDKDCPEGTCTVDCGDHRCCYDPNTGIAVKVIPL
jgi:hypothetical protein